VKLKESIKKQIITHAEIEFPKESCGLVIVKKGKQLYISCNNLGVGTDNFVLDPVDYDKADQQGEIVAVIHSHPNMSANPSQADLVACEASGLPWWIVGIPSQKWAYLEPSGYKAPLVGREWSHGVLDCYAIIKDWYKQERNIELPDFARSDEWWKDGQNLYLDNILKVGFKPIEQKDLQTGDVILMTIGSSVPNHGALYLGDGVILHHIQNRLSTREIFGGYYLKNTTGYYRYENS
jgi:proteasome lid subunit RPN8/RPN11